MLREYTASFTSVKPCLYQPPPGTAIVVAARPAGVKLHLPARSTELIAPLPAATPATPAAATAPIAPGGATADAGIARATPPATTAAASPPAAAGNQPRRRAFERCMSTSCDSSASFATPVQGTASRPIVEPIRQICRHRRPPGRVVAARMYRYELMGVSSVKSRFQDGHFLLLTPRRLRVAADEDDPSGVPDIALRHAVSPAHRRGADRATNRFASAAPGRVTRRRRGQHCDPRRSRRA